MATGTYEGRIACDGDGNLLADEKTWVGTKTVAVFDADGEPVLDENGVQVTTQVPQYRIGKNHGKHIAHDLEKKAYVFVKPGEPSHNERHHKQMLVIDGTADAGMTDDPDLVNADESVNPHHFGTTADDPHYDPSAPNNTRIKSSPDKIAVTETGHTAAYKED